MYMSLNWMWYKEFVYVLKVLIVWLFVWCCGRRLDLGLVACCLG